MYQNVPTVMFDGVIESRGLAVVAAAAVLLVGATGWADDGGEESGVETVDQDYEFGLHDPGREAALEPGAEIRGLIDRRTQFDPLSSHTIGWPTGSIPPAGTVTVTNRMLYGQRLAAAVTEGLELFGEAYLPLGSQTYLGGGARFRVADGEAWSLSVGTSGRFRRTNFRPGTADGGVGLDAVFDAVATDNTAWNVGIAAHVPVYQTVEQVDFEGCDNRREWAESRCGTTRRDQTWMPRSGWWASVFAGVNHFVTDWLVLNVEAFSGLSQGNFWALESALNPELAYDEELRLVEETDVSAGLGPLGVFTLGLGSSWRLGGLGVQTSVFLTNYRGEARILPWLSAAYRFGGS